MYVRRPLLFIGIGLFTIPVSVVITVLQTGIVNASTFLGITSDGEGAGFRAQLVLAVGVLLTLFGLSLVQAASASAMAKIDTGGAVSALSAFRTAARRIRPLLGALVLAVAIVSLLTFSVFLIPVAIVFATRWALLVPCAVLERNSGFGVLRRSGGLAGREWWKVLSLVVVSAILVIAAGPVLGGLLLLGTSASFALVNTIAGLVYALLMPLVGITTTYVYYDAATREQLERDAPRLRELPAEVSV
jgi:hypothetical protein